MIVCVCRNSITLIRSSLVLQEVRPPNHDMLQELLEIQVEKGEKRAEEQTRIAKAREELLELKLR
jgi:hypothetical protein